MSSIELISVFEPPCGAFLVQPKIAGGYDLKFVNLAKTEQRTIGHFATRQSAVDSIVAQHTGITAWDQVPPEQAQTILWDKARWSSEPIIEWDPTTESRPVWNPSPDERVPSTAPPRNPEQ
jgi:hypothetical protein